MADETRTLTLDQCDTLASVRHEMHVVGCLLGQSPDLPASNIAEGLAAMLSRWEATIAAATDPRPAAS